MQVATEGAALRLERLVRTHAKGTMNGQRACLSPWLWVIHSLPKTKPALATVWLVSLNSLTPTPRVAKSIASSQQMLPLSAPLKGAQAISSTTSPASLGFTTLSTED